jgi:integration host factor subunit beta
MAQARSDVIDALVWRFPALGRSNAELVVITLIEALSVALVEGRRVEIRGFGSFNCIQREPRSARNPKSGKQVQVGFRRRVHFKPGKDLQQAVL